MRRRVVIAAAGAGAALAVAAGGVAVATGGGTANSVETDGEDGATYEVEVTRPDGSTVGVRLDDHVRVVVIEGDGDSGGS